MEAIDELAEALRERLVERARGGAGGTDVGAEVARACHREAAVLSEAERAGLAERVLLLATGLGPLEPLLSDPAVDEVMVNGPGDGLRRAARPDRADRRARSSPRPSCCHAIERILAPLGRRVDEASPLCDARLPDGSRVNVVIPPLSLDGPVPDGPPLPARGLLAGAAGRRSARCPATRRSCWRACVAARASILVSGGTGSGKTTTLNALSGAIPERRADRDDRGRRRAAPAPAATSYGWSRGRRASRDAAR